MSTQKQLSIGERRLILISGSVFVAGLLALLFAFMSQGGTPVEPPNHLQTTTSAAQAASSTQDLTGQWVAESNGVKLVASVKNDTINVSMKNNDTTINWWDGSFVSSGADGDTIASIKSTDTDDIMVSSSQTKMFTVGDKTLTFDMSFMGVTKTVTMQHV
jgi:hypothetical protein